MGEPLHVLEHRMDVHRLAFDRALVGENLHTVDELDDAISLLADQLGKAAVIVAYGLLKQLCRSADAGKRIFDLVREHGGQRTYRTSRPSMRELPIHFVGDGAFL